jgi:phosphoglycolate phosphatase-like HAD superfamily hydrolase
MRALALDFDGVICDSGREVFITALRTDVAIDPRSRWQEKLHGIADAGGATGFDFNTDIDYQAFVQLQPLGNRAEDFGVALKICAAGLRVADQQQYYDYFKSQDAGWLRRFHQTFYNERHAFRRENEGDWLALHRAYEGFIDLLRRHADATSLAIVTAKDKNSVRRLLDHMGIGGLFPLERTFDKDTGRHKTSHLRAYSEQTALPLEAITFVDDKVNHLQGVAPLGVRCVLAGWGYNSTREWRIAERENFPVATLETAEEILFAPHYPG